jgi:predicted Zn-dependent protease with MMP-like domain
VAESEVAATIDGLPADVRDRIAEVPVTFEDRPNEAMARSGIDRDATLGLFVGVPYPRAIAVSQLLPPQIILFLANILRYSGGDEAGFRRQIRKTLLHEIGHYLGLDEDGLGVRGLR